jgi:DNA repair protein RadA/Sms
VLLPAIEGTRPILVEVQALVAESDLAMPRRAATGFDRNRLAMILAVLGRHAGVPLASSDVFVNVAGGVRIDEPAADLAVAVAIVSALRGEAPEEGLACFGEIGLTGGLRPVGHTDARMREARKLGVSAVVAPKGTDRFDGVALRGAEGIADALAEALPR